MITTLTSKLLGFEHLKDLYAIDSDFGDIHATCEKVQLTSSIGIRVLFHGNRICILVCSTRELLVEELHCGGLISHFGMHKTLEVLSKQFY